MCKSYVVSGLANPILTVPPWIDRTLSVVTESPCCIPVPLKPIAIEWFAATLTLLPIAIEFVPVAIAFWPKDIPVPSACEFLPTTIPPAVAVLLWPKAIGVPVPEPSRTLSLPKAIAPDVTVLSKP